MKKFARYDPARDPHATEFIPVARAAALLHDRLLPGHPTKDAHTLDALAQALGERVPMYLRDPNTGQLRTLDKAAIARGRFARGATRLEYGDDAPLRFLLVSQRELHPALEAIASDPASPLLRMFTPLQAPAMPAAKATTF